MAIKFLTHLIEKYPCPVDKVDKWELSHWLYASDLPYVAMRHHIGFYRTIDDAEAANAKEILVAKFSNEW